MNFNRCSRLILSFTLVIKPIRAFSLMYLMSTHENQSVTCCFFFTLNTVNKIFIGNRIAMIKHDNKNYVWFMLGSFLCPTRKKKIRNIFGQTFSTNAKKVKSIHVDCNDFQLRSIFYFLFISAIHHLTVSLIAGPLNASPLKKIISKRPGKPKNFVYHFD